MDFIFLKECMKATLKKAIWAIAILVTLACVTLIILLISTEIPLLGEEEEERIKADKHFWEWPSPYGSLKTHYIEKGEGSRHVILIHGFRSHTYTWKALIDPLANAGYHVWAIDLIGFGLSDKPDHAVYNPDFFVEQIHAFMDSKGISQAHLIGNSMGGGLALSFAIDYPEQVHSLTLLNALGYPLEIPFYMSFGKHVTKICPVFLGPTMIRYGLKQIVYNQELVTDEQVEAYSLPYRFPGGIKASLATLDNFDNQILVKMERHYPSLHTPALIIWGDHDQLIPLSHYEKFIKDFPHAEKLLINNCGHIPQEEAPDEVLAILLPFLEKERIVIPARSQE